ncbi:hypothetical protein [Streptomyces sp. NPDC023838]|uniref:hypothetical protein n=1 Tax=Streptomyces sp. NPDC023838 TaxID=3154325 RepID=UPI0033D9DF70
MPEMSSTGRAVKRTPLAKYLSGIETGKSPAAENTPAGEGEWGVLKVSAVQAGRFEPVENKVVREAAHIRPEFEVRQGNLLMTRANTEALVGLACVVASPTMRLMLSDKTLRLVVDEKLADPSFVALSLLQPETRSQIRGLATGTSAGMKNISQAQIRRLEVPDLSLAEQRQIVAAHAAFERRIGALERVHSKLLAVEKAVVASAMARAPRKVPLGSWLERIETGKSPLAEDTPAGDGEWGVLKVSAVQAGWFNAAENKVIRDASAIHPEYEVNSGDLLMTRANTEALVGLTCMAQTPPPRLMLSDKTLRLVVDPAAADARFVELALLSPSVRSQVRARATGTSGSMKNISQAAVRGLLLPDIAAAQQRDLVELVLATRQRSDVMKRQIAKLRTIQQGVVEDLLSGKVRVPAE